MSEYQLRHDGASRRGSIFLFALGLMLVMVALAFSFLATTRKERDSGETLNMLSLAEMAARQGADHAIEVLTDDYLSEPGVPTHLGLGFRTAFAPIDTFKVGKEGGNPHHYRPVGDNFSYEDENENDTKTEFLLNTVYNSTYQGDGSYRWRHMVYGDGMMLSRGVGRYIEPGRYHTNLVDNPISFHLEHPVAADPGHYDPAVRRGENYLPDRDDAFYLDHDLLPVDTREEARFRLRYAVVAEDLSGHLPMSWQDEYIHGVPDARSAVIDTPEANQINEVNNVIGNRYADSAYNLCLSYKPWWGWLIARGEGYTTFTPGTDTNQTLNRYHYLKHFDTGKPYRHHQDNMDQPPEQSEEMGYGHLWSTHRGPLMSHGGGRAFRGQMATAPEHVYTYTPYGRQPVVTNSPSEWRDSYVDSPWQLNLPTAVPDAVTRMVYAYMPKEFNSFKYIKREKYKFKGLNAEGHAKWEWYADETVDIKSSIPRIELFTSANFASHFAHLGAQAYPGTDPSNPGSWREDLGKEIDLNTTDFGLGLDMYKIAPRAPFWGVKEMYLPDLKNNYTEKWETDVINISERWELKMGDHKMQALTEHHGYYYEDSYFMDCAIALFHAISAAQLAWLPDNGGSSDAFPLDGRVEFPSGLSHPDLQPLAGDGLPTPARDRQVMDRDVDGDGKFETPSAFDSIKKVDAQFVRNLGEYFGPELAAEPGQGLYVVKINPTTYGPTQYRSHATYEAWTPSNNIASLLASATITADEAELMELVLNDMRMSFFGASPQYTDFQGIDFDNDGTVHCSAYAGGSVSAGADRFGRVVNPGAGDERFSLSGCFMFQKSHYFRVFVCGEVFDMVRELPTEQTVLEMVYAVDPAGRAYNVFNAERPGVRDPNGDGDTRDADIENQMLFQRWHWIRQQSYRPHSYP